MKLSTRLRCKNGVAPNRGQPLAVPAAVQRTEALGSARLRYSRDTGPARGHPNLLALQEGVADFRRRRVLLNCYLPEDLVGIEAALHGRRGPAGRGDIVGVAVFEPGSQYFRDDRGRWVRLSTAKGESRVVMDPTWLFEVLVRTVAQTVSLSSETSDGIELHHYEMALDLRQARRTPPSLGRGAHPRTWGLRSRRLAAHVWIGEEDGLIHRMAWCASSGPARALSSEAPAWSTTEFFDFGVEAEIDTRKISTPLTVCPLASPLRRAIARARVLSGSRARACGGPRGRV